MWIFDQGGPGSPEGQEIVWSQWGDKSGGLGGARGRGVSVFVCVCKGSRGGGYLSAEYSQLKAAN